ncbi:uncharacterized protein Z519_02149 [Cladophialophora bantiana CBS 173.52]|uniref:Uncharacterized protein n=1 Tax=Cladophialophora bantiana (strain ATCC 10958 / CBS 173.52 / CDC B-1940 / NIH 8579) TaxID=1442370 RepID=A0A0D2HTH8_CLAB1|nr:uncharacterized protein Z519_02149 [Cladophialophora bantiana CBS 173.52]KIW96758.1 hypothetical protein Z519_02149 [Cladophialophora bantiana CBS 173.52]
MQVAAFLSDLKSLSVCSHEAAVALVKPSLITTADDTNQSPAKAEDTPGRPLQPSASEEHHDQDLQRANELVSLYYDVKLKYLKAGPDTDLVQAGKDVDQIIAALSSSKGQC